MKKIITLIVISTLIIAGCSSGKYADKIDKAVNKQQHYQKKLAEQHKGDIERKFDKKDANIYVYEKGCGLHSLTSLVNFRQPYT